MLRRQLRFRDLKAQGVVSNWVTLNNWIDEKGFPPGRLIGANTRVWDEAEVVAWLEAQPINRKSVPFRASPNPAAA